MMQIQTSHVHALCVASQFLSDIISLAKDGLWRDSAEVSPWTRAIALTSILGIPDTINFPLLHNKLQLLTHPLINSQFCSLKSGTVRLASLLRLKLNCPPATFSFGPWGPFPSSFLLLAEFSSL